jgi:hypothetical protein
MFYKEECVDKRSRRSQNEIIQEEEVPETVEKKVEALYLRWVDRRSLVMI